MTPSACRITCPLGHSGDPELDARPAEALRRVARRRRGARSIRPRPTCSVTWSMSLSSSAASGLGACWRGGHRRAGDAGADGRARVAVPWLLISAELLDPENLSRFPLFLLDVWAMMEAGGRPGWWPTSSFAWGGGRARALPPEPGARPHVRRAPSPSCAASCALSAQRGGRVPSRGAPAPAADRAGGGDPGRCRAGCRYRRATGATIGRVQRVRRLIDLRTRSG